MPDISLFTETQGNFLIRLLLAHLVADFLLQNKKMVTNKKWLSKAMMAHIFVVFLMTALLSQNLIIAIIITLLHYLTDGIKMTLLKNKKYSETLLFIADQIVHVATIVICWSLYFGINQNTWSALMLPFTNFKISLVLFGFILVTSPYGYLIGLTTRRFQNEKNNETKTDKNGFYIGIFERLIILVFMLLGEYSAIGFLITGKSIIRFSSKNEDKKSEYVLLGTMISYGITIITGVILKQLL
ncbi:MAG: DUF3307 domain-containing protein [Flavobacterium sp. JAD_PAG50586_2]|nr:MAG: DUF3307 domain-containing protein [Flavobacterium sp. JAD_PAG50586_2]